MALPGFFRKVMSHLGLRKDEDDRSGKSSRGGGAPGFKARRAVPSSGIVEVPVVSQCNYGNCGVQGLKWYSDMLRADDDGDVAQEFFQESTYVGQDKKKKSRLKREPWTRPVKLKGPPCAVDGNVRQFVELSGEMYWA